MARADTTAERDAVGRLIAGVVRGSWELPSTVDGDVLREVAMEAKAQWERTRRPSFRDFDPVDTVSPEVAAALVGLKPRGLESLRQRGGGPVFVRVGRRVVYQVAALLEWLAQNSRQSTTDG